MFLTSNLFTCPQEKKRQWLICLHLRPGAVGGEMISWVLVHVRRQREHRWCAVVDTVSWQYNVLGLVSLAFKHGACMFLKGGCAHVVSLSPPLLYILAA